MNVGGPPPYGPIHLVRDVIAPFVVTRAALIAIALSAAALIPYGRTWCEPHCDLSSSPLLNAASRWDGGEYLSVARDGYSYEPGTLSNVAFAPLLPLLMRGFAQIAGRTDGDALIAAGLIVVNAALLVALVYLVALGGAEVGAAAARRAALYLLVFPTTIFLSALYAESLFLAAASGALFEARQGRWWRAGALGALGALARPFGFVMAVPLAVEMLVARSRAPVRRVDVLALLLPVAAFVGWQAYLYRLFGDPLVYFAAQRTFRRELSAPLGAIGDLFDPRVYGDPWLVAASVLLMTALIVASWRVLRPGTATAGTVLLAATLSSGTFVSFPRYALALFPAFLVLGTLGERRAVHVAYLIAAGIISVLLAAMFASWFWVA